MSERVRALLIAPGGELLLIKRVKPGRAPYWVLPGGHREPGDATREDALRREIREELAGETDIHALVQVVGTEGDRQYIYLCRIDSHDFANRTGPEFSDTSRGQYILNTVPLSPRGLDGLTILPPEVGAFLASRLAAPDDLWTLPDLRGLPADAAVDRV